MRTSTRIWFASSSLIFLCTLSAGGVSTGATISVLDITGTGARNFSDPSIWDPLPARPNLVPGSGDLPVVDFGDGISDYVYIDADTNIQRFNVGNMLSGGLEIRSGATLTTNLGGNNQSNVGQNGIGHLRIKSGATLAQSGLLNLGLNAGTGTVTLENGAAHTVGNFLGVGGQGTAAYNMLGGSLTVANYVQIGWSNANGNGAFKQSAGALQIDRNSATGQGLYVGIATGATGLYEISGGSLSVAASNLGVFNGATTGVSTATFRVVGSAPTITVGSNYIQRPSATLDLVIDAGGISLIDLGGSATLDGVLSASFTTVPTIGQEFPIIKYAGTRTGTFAAFDSLVDSPLGPDTVQLALDYGSGTNDVVKLTVIPEPSGIVLSGLGLTALICCRRVRRIVSAME